MTPAEVKFDKWCQDFCDGATGASVISGLRQLGPISNFSDLLLSATSSTPQKVVAAEQLIHMVEGWRYAAAAVTAFLSHSEGAAIHFAYYAELRAVMSLFARSGLRIKQKDYYYLDNAGQKISVTNERTHAAVWALWKKWVDRNDTQNLFLEKIRISPRATLKNFATELAYVNPTAALKNWGRDLQHVTLDHEARNVSSYNAYWTDKALTMMGSSDPGLVKEIWQLFMPDATGLVFDAALISRFFNESIRAIIEAPEDVQAARIELIGRISGRTGLDAALLGQLLSGTYPVRPFDLAASPQSKAENVLSRGFFLLRLAMLGVKTSLMAANNQSLSTWIAHWLTHAGLWSPALGVELRDLQDDYQNALDEFDYSDPLPQSLWSGQNTAHTTKLIRPEACIAWGLQ